MDIESKPVDGVTYLITTKEELLHRLAIMSDVKFTLFASKLALTIAPDEGMSNFRERVVHTLYQMPGMPGMN